MKKIALFCLALLLSSCTDDNNTESESLFNQYRTTYLGVFQEGNAVFEQFFRTQFASFQAVEENEQVVASKYVSLTPSLINIIVTGSINQRTSRKCETDNFYDSCNEVVQDGKLL